jgi:hypothetical protein
VRRAIEKLPNPVVEAARQGETNGWIVAPDLLHINLTHQRTLAKEHLAEVVNWRWSDGGLHERHAFVANRDADWTRMLV